VPANVSLRRAIGAVAVVATVVSGIGASASPAGAATGQTATLSLRTVTVTGTAARDVIAITLDTDRLTVDVGSDGSVDAQFRRSRFDRVRVLAGGGADGVTVEGVGVGDVPITMKGQGGNDFLGVVGNIGDFGDFGEGNLPVTMIGNDGNDDFLAGAPGPVTIQAGAGDDSVDGGLAGTGQETISLGDGSDRFLSSLNGFIVGGSRNDIVDGGAGQDAIDMEGTFATESVGLSANSGHLIVDHDFRDRIDADNIEDVSWRGFGGLDESGSGDAVAVNDLSGTDVVRFTPDFTDPLDGAGPNNSADTLTVRGTTGVDHITVSGSGANVTVAGLTPLVTPVFLAPDDFLLIQTLDGRDIVDSSELQPGLVQLIVQ
jgi:hypothetical protein